LIKTGKYFVEGKVREPRVEKGVFLEWVSYGSLEGRIWKEGDSGRLP
jgi:hypothetical protein